MGYAQVVMGVAVVSMPVMAWAWLREYREMTARHRRQLEEMRWRHFEEMMRLSYWSWVVRQALEDEE